MVGLHTLPGQDVGEGPAHSCPVPPGEGGKQVSHLDV